MDRREVSDLEQEYYYGAAGAGQQPASWRNNVMRQVGAVALTLCPTARKLEPCAKTDCVLRPFCACARRELSAANRLESRVWLGIALCAVLTLVLVIALVLLR